MNPDFWVWKLTSALGLGGISEITAQSPLKQSRLRLDGSQEERGQLPTPLLGRRLRADCGYFTEAGASAELSQAP